MATRAENIQTAIDNYWEYIATQSDNPKPSYTAPNGQSVSWGEHETDILDRIEKLEAKLDGPVEVISQAIT